MTNNKYQKASDLFNQQTPFFGKKSDFSKSFPTILEVSVTVEELGYILYEGDQERHFSKKNLPEFIDCREPNCYGGGVPIGNILRKMVENKKQTQNIELPCIGREGSPKGKKTYGKCRTDFIIDIKIKYKKE